MPGAPSTRLQANNLRVRDGAMYTPGPSPNRLLGILREELWFRYRLALRPVTFDCGHRIVEHHTAISELFFPISCVISRLYTGSSGQTAEMGMVGCEGVVGVSVFLGDDTAAHDYVVLVGGQALAMEAGCAKELFKAEPRFQIAVLNYVLTMMRQVSQIAVCNSLHSTEQRLCRWLLLTVERTPTPVIRINHDTLAHLISVRRESVTGVLGHLQQRSAVRTGRGYIEVIDRSALMTYACECYGIIRGEYEALRHDSHVASM
jgi:CRP-like cAMP-binding protein